MLSLSQCIPLHKLITLLSSYAAHDTQSRHLNIADLSVNVKCISSSTLVHPWRFV